MAYESPYPVILLFIAVYSGKTPQGANRSKANSITLPYVNFKPIRNPQKGTKWFTAENAEITY
jgi:hypothetical protein